MHDDLRAATPVGDAVAARSVPRGDTVGVAAADGDGWAVSLIQSVYHAFGSGLVDPDTGILFHDRGTSFSLDAGSPNVLAPRKRPLHTLMPVIVTESGELRHVLSTMGGQGQPQILTQVLLRMLDGQTAADAVAAPRAVVGQQALGCTDDSVVVEADADDAALASLHASSFEIVDRATAFGDPRSGQRGSVRRGRRTDRRGRPARRRLGHGGAVRPAPADGVGARRTRWCAVICSCG